MARITRVEAQKVIEDNWTSDWEVEISQDYLAALDVVDAARKRRVGCHQDVFEDIAEALRKFDEE